MARLNLQPISGYNNWSVIFYNLWVSDDDSNVAVWLDYSINNFPTKYFDSLSTVIDGNYSFINCTSVSCSLNGIIIPNWGSIVAYKNNLVPCLSTCLFETRTCNNWVLNWSYVNLSCSVESCQPQPPNLWGGWWSYLLKDDCPDWDNSPSYYDNSCGWLHSSPNICDVDNSNYSSEIKWAYLYSYGYSITTMCPIVEADLDWYLRRNHFAKMISQFATNVLWDQPNIWKEGCDKFKDIDWDTDELKWFMKKSCELGLMWLEADGITPYEVFNPSSFVTRAEFGTVFSRLLFWLKYNIKDESIVFNQKWFWYKDHLDALNRYGVMTKIDWDWPQKLELRWWIMLMMQRADMYWIFAWKIPALNWIKALFE